MPHNTQFTRCWTVWLFAAGDKERHLSNNKKRISAGVDAPELKTGEFKKMGQL